MIVEMYIGIMTTTLNLKMLVDIDILGAVYFILLVRIILAIVMERVNFGL